MRENIKFRDKTPPPDDPPNVEPIPEGIRIRVVPEFDSENARHCHEQDIEDFLKVLNHLEVKAQVIGLKKIGTFGSKRSRITILKVSNVWEKTHSVFSCPNKKF